MRTVSCRGKFTSSLIRDSAPGAPNLRSRKSRVVLRGSMTGSREGGNGACALKSVCVFCGSSSGKDEVFTHAARALGKEIADRSITLVYGGGNVGLMGEVARTVLGNQGNVIGVIPEKLFPREVSGAMLGDTRVVNSMHERKATMAAESEAFIALPGGFGTIEELMEMVTWTQLGHHQKAVGILNINGFYDHLLSFLSRCHDEGFLRKDGVDLIQVGATPGELIDKLQAFNAKYTVAK